MVQRRPEWRRLYNTARWRKLRLLVLADEPTCRLCSARGKLSAATVVDHEQPHKGDEALFWQRSNLRALCKRCHDRKTATEDSDSAFGRWQRIPTFIGAPAVPVTLVVGPPGAGKTTWARDNANARTRVIDVDAIAADVSGLPVHQVDMREWLPATMRERNEQLALLARKRRGVDRATLIVSTPTLSDRRAWRRLLRTNDVIVLETREEVCVERVSRSGRLQMDGAVQAISRWWRRYVADPADRRIVT